MKVQGKIILVDDEKYEKELLSVALDKLNIQVDLEYFDNGADALNYLKTTSDKVFLIISDMDMPEMDGLELKKAIDKDKELNEKAIPFIFQSSFVQLSKVKEAYDYRVQGYFEKPADTESIAVLLDIIIRYWIISKRPDNLIQ